MVNFKSLQRTPVIIAVGVVLLVCFAHWRQPRILESLEDRTYDWRVCLATNFPRVTATNLGFVAITDESIDRLMDGSLQDGKLEFRYGLYWPRHIYGRLLRELSAQEATVVGFDLLFEGLRPDHSPILVSSNTNPGLEEFIRGLHSQEQPLSVDGQINVESDDFFAWQLHCTGIGIIASEKGMLSHQIFRDQAVGIGDIAAERDSDGILRRVRAFKRYRFWHPLFEWAAKKFKLDLEHAKIDPQQIILSNAVGEQVKIPLAADGTFNPLDFGGMTATNIPRSKPFSEKRIWHMGILLAARGLDLDLDNASVDLPHGKIILRGRNGLERVIPVDPDGFFYVDWQLTARDRRLTVEPVEKLLAQNIARSNGETNGLENPWRGHLIIVGSTATGNDLTDLGATPLEKETILMSKHWNVANSILTGHFIRRTTLAQDCLIIALLGALAAAFTLRLRSLPALLSVLAIAGIYIGLAVFIYVHHRFWLPIFLPVVITLSVQYVGLVTWRVIFEQAEKRRVRSIFSKIVAPEVVHELLAADKVSLGGTRREITVLFADVRGFTAFTDTSRENATKVAREKNLSGFTAEEHFDREARETLDTVNAYLALVADIVKKHSGTLDKYIGDCVMAFWNAPAHTPHHALTCVRAAIDAQREIDKLNRQREQENKNRARENAARTAAGLPPLSPLPILSLGTGINTGQVIVGLMGSDAHILNYTVFGREVNLASRLESLSGHGRILIGEATHAALCRDDPTLAATCTALSPASVKGFREAVNVFEVPWRTPDLVSAAISDFSKTK